MSNFTLDLTWPLILELNEAGDELEKSNRFAKLTEEMGELADAMLRQNTAEFKAELVDVALMIASIFGDHFPQDNLQMFMYGCGGSLSVPLKDAQSDWLHSVRTRMLQLQRAVGLASEAIQIMTGIPSSQYKRGDDPNLAQRRILDALAICFKMMSEVATDSQIQQIWNMKMEKWASNLEVEAPTND